MAKVAKNVFSVVSPPDSTEEAAISNRLITTLKPCPFTLLTPISSLSRPPMPNPKPPNSKADPCPAVPRPGHQDRPYQPGSLPSAHVARANAPTNHVPSRQGLRPQKPSPAPQLLVTASLVRAPHPQSRSPICRTTLPRSYRARGGVRRADVWRSISPMEWGAGSRCEARGGGVAG
jgi:hypothetical protein